MMRNRQLLAIKRLGFSCLWCIVLLFTGTGQAMQLTGYQKRQYPELAKACRKITVDKNTQSHFRRMLADDATLAHWLNQQMNNNDAWNRELIQNAEGWHTLHKTNPEFIQALGQLATQPRLFLFYLPEIQELMKSFPLTTAAIKTLMETKSRLAIELLNNLQRITITKAASRATDHRMQAHIMMLAVNSEPISELIILLSQLRCHRLTAAMLIYFNSWVFDPIYSIQLTIGLSQLAQGHPALLQAISAPENNHKNILSLFELIALNPDFTLTAADQASIADQGGATACPYCLKTFFSLFGIVLITTVTASKKIPE